VRIDSPAIALHRTRVQRGGRWGLALVSLGLALGAVAGIVSPGWIVAGLVGPLASLCWYWLAKPLVGRRGGKPGQLAIDDKRIVIRRGSSERVLLVSEVEGAWWESVGEGESLVIRCKSGDEVAATVEPGDRARVQQELASAGIDVTAVTMRLVGGDSRGLRAFIGCTSLGFAATALLTAVTTLRMLWRTVPSSGSVVVGVVIGFLMTALLAALAGWYAWSRQRALIGDKVTIGRDGLRVKPALSRSRFIAFDELAHAKSGPKGVELTTAEDRLSLGLHASHASKSALLERIASARQSHREGAQTVAVDLLERGSRDADTWLEDLKTLLGREAGYRKQRLSPEQLLGVVEDPNASAEQRVGAALALSPSADEPTRTRLRIAAEGCARAPLRIALESAANGELELARLAEIEEAAEPRRRGS
jgi:hypothetical protein